ncbi:MAG: zinc-ribbon domain-containing protein [Xanthobacteraceae bacterium]
MLIVCPNCATSYDVDAATLLPGGRRVRCVRCRTIWQAELPHKEKLIAAAEALAPHAVKAAAEVSAAAGAGQGDPPPPDAEELRLDANLAADLAQTAAASAAGQHGSDGLDEPPSASPDSADDVAVAEDGPAEVESPPTAPTEPEGDILPIETDAGPEAPNDDTPEDIESVAARRFQRPNKRVRLQWPLLRLQSAILALIVFDAIVVGWRGDFVRAMPQTASFYAWLGLPVNVRGLDFGGLTTATEQHDGVPILVVRGNIVNITDKTENVPHLRFAVRNAARQEVYSWSALPAQRVVAAGQAIAFQSRLASPPPDSHDVLVRFVNRYDILAGMR